jgi:alcohol dehydrogenase (nicotinoprotein)
MKTKAAVLREMGKEWEVIELDLDPPKAGEVLVRYVASGLCHSDDHLRTGDIPVRYPIVGGHEGAGVVEEVGPGVTRLKPGDHIVCSFLPACGHCRFCARGQTNLCDMGYLLVENSLPDGTFRFHADGQAIGDGRELVWARVTVIRRGYGHRGPGCARVLFNRPRTYTGSWPRKSDIRDI